MPNRYPIKRAHERACVQSFIDWHRQAYGSSFQIAEMRESPDAIITTKRTTRWVEVGDAFWNNDWARDLYTYATPGETYEPISSDVHTSMDEQLAANFVKVLKAKLAKLSYRGCAQQYEPGYLVISLMYPIPFDAYSVRCIKRAWAAEQTVANQGFFRSIFVRVRDLPDFHRWPVPPRTLLAA